MSPLWLDASQPFVQFRYCFSQMLCVRLLAKYIDSEISSKDWLKDENCILLNVGDQYSFLFDREIHVSDIYVLLGICMRFEPYKLIDTSETEKN